MARASDTIAAIATPPGRGGVGVVRVSGPDVPAMIDGRSSGASSSRGVATRSDVSRRPRRAARPGARALLSGAALVHRRARARVARPRRTRGAAACCSRAASSSARGWPNPANSRKRAFLNGKLDLAQAEGVADLIDAATATAARAAARSLSGAFSREVRALVDALTELRMFTEATLDFPDEDLDFLRAADAQRQARGDSRADRPRARARGAGRAAARRPRRRADRCARTSASRAS